MPLCASDVFAELARRGQRLPSACRAMIRVARGRDGSVKRGSCAAAGRVDLVIVNRALHRPPGRGLARELNGGLEWAGQS